MYIVDLACFQCGASHSSSVRQNRCRKCHRPLLARYDHARVADHMRRETLSSRSSTLWRYRELLPVAEDSAIVTLGEGMTPLLRIPRAGERFGIPALWLKDESQNPTQSFKARGMAVAVSMAKQLHVEKIAVASAGNAGAALAIYAARAGIPCHVFMPRDSARANVTEVKESGAGLTLIDGLISDCGEAVERWCTIENAFNVSTLNEPYRVEGKKTMGLELAEQLAWTLPDAIVYPTGGGSGIIGMWKAFDELERIGWIGPKRPKLFSVQASGCSPIAHAYNGAQRQLPIDKPAFNRPSGLRVPKPLGVDIVIDILRKSRGDVIVVSEHDILSGIRELAATEGIFASPEGGAAYAAIAPLRDSGAIKGEDTVVVFNTGAGARYTEWFD